jgi:hypothetical protein
MNKKQALFTLAVAAGITATTLYLLKKAQKKKRRAFVSNAGYEMAYDVHFPIRYRKSKKNI